FSIRSCRVPDWPWRAAWLLELLSRHSELAPARQRAISPGVDQLGKVMLTLLNESAFRTATVCREPYEHVLIDDSVKRMYEASMLADAPRIGAPGSFALSSLRYGPGFAALISELESEDFRSIVESKLGIDLHDYPTMVTVRGYCNRDRDGDGYIHTDSRQKI